jgi:hypothetical protein
VSLNVSPQRLIQALFFLCRAVSIGYSCALVKLFSAKEEPPETMTRPIKIRRRGARAGQGCA